MTKGLSVTAIMVPVRAELGLRPCVGPEDGITKGLKVMLKNNLKLVSVILGQEVLGMIRIEDALAEVGLARDLTGGRE